MKTIKILTLSIVLSGHIFASQKTEKMELPLVRAPLGMVPGPGVVTGKDGILRVPELSEQLLTRKDEEYYKQPVLHALWDIDLETGQKDAYVNAAREDCTMLMDAADKLAYDAVEYLLQKGAQTRVVLPKRFVHCSTFKWPSRGMFWSNPVFEANGVYSLVLGLLQHQNYSCDKVTSRDIGAPKDKREKPQVVYKEAVTMQGHQELIQNIRKETEQLEGRCKEIKRFLEEDVPYKDRHFHSLNWTVDKAVYAVKVAQVLLAHHDKKAKGDDAAKEGEKKKEADKKDGE